MLDGGTLLENYPVERSHMAVDLGMGQKEKGDKASGDARTTWRYNAFI